jgi:hypothetical protein
VPTDPYVPSPLDERPRQQQNFARGVHMPAARGWRADRPGDGARPDGALVGAPGPNVGFALTLAHRARERFRLGAGEHLEDAVAVVAELAMKRASVFGRGPTTRDVDFAAELLGYTGPTSDGPGRWRPGRVRGAAHEYAVRRGVVDSVSAALLRRPVTDLPGLVVAARAAIEAGVVAHDTADAAPTAG